MNKNKNKIIERVNLALKNIDQFSGYGAVYHSINGESAPLMGKALCRLCQGCVKHGNTETLCRHEATVAAYQAFVSGDAYYGKCWLGLHYLVMPVATSKGDILGAIEIGGLLPPGGFHFEQHNMMATLSAITNDNSLFNTLTTFQGVDETLNIDIENLKNFLIETIFSNGLLDAPLFETNKASWTQQMRLSSLVNRKGAFSVSQRRRSVLLLADKLILLLNTMNEEKLLKIVDEILTVSLGGSEEGVENLDLKSIKAYLLPVLSVISMNSLLEKEKWSKVMALYSRHVDEMANIDNVKELCFWFESLVLNLRSFKAAKRDLEGELLSDRLITFFYNSYSEHISIKRAAKHLGASQSSIMHKIRKETGRTFSQLLNGIRIKEAKRLLTFTTLPLNEISFRCGFSDQSYFTKVFVKYINLTPGEFRKLLKMDFD